MASRHTVGDQSPSERLCLYPDSSSLTRARNLVRGSHLDMSSAFRRCGRDLVEFFNNPGWALYGKLTSEPASFQVARHAPGMRSMYARWNTDLECATARRDALVHWRSPVTCTRGA